MLGGERQAAIRRLSKDFLSRVLGGEPDRKNCLKALHFLSRVLGGERVL